MLTRRQQSKGPIDAHLFFSQRVELNAPPTQRQLATILAATDSSTDRESLTSLASDPNYRTSVTLKNYSILDMLDDHPSAYLTLPSYISMLKPLSPRQYSISSSPLASHRFDPTRTTYSLTLTYDVHVSPALSGAGRTYRGVASSYLARLRAGDRIHGYVRPTGVAFRLPASAATPVIMVAAGTGLAPMRGFVEERVALAAATNQKLGPALLYFGCRDCEKDFICREELRAAEADGAVSLRPTFSRRGGAGGFRYAHERIWAEREECARLFMEGARILLCGSASKLGKSTGETLKRIWREGGEGRTEEEAEEWLQRQKEDRYVTDVFD